MAEPSGNKVSSSAARARTSLVYSTPGGQTVAAGGSEISVAADDGGRGRKGP